MFYPVDQQSALESKSHSHSSKSGVGTGSSSGVSQSPPDVGPAAFESHREIGGFHTVPSNAPTDYHRLALDHDHLANLEGQGFNQMPEAMDQAGSAYRQQTGAQSPWFGSEGFQYPMSSITHSSPEFPAHHYWRHNSITSPADYAPFPYSFDATSTPPQTHNQNPYAFTQQRTDSMWPHPQQQPVRSMSFPHIEGYAQNMSQYGAFQQGAMHQPTAVRPLPPTLDIPNATTMTHAPAPRSAPIEQHPHSLNAFSMQQGQYYPNGVHQVPNQSYQSYDSPHLSSVREEQTSPSNGSSKFAVQSTHPG